ncbi:sulfonate ABC transporter ATP-binding protein [Caballeronia choica]|uniref:Sulfonate ABC transporter ATP-binding protein n=1 Tax=Caballeronia choica TaxID=326476 RepID=A0A158K5T4_9BURK|nr:ATP-binding cassette domain-containing protein [Caballeronia choica]SAL76508.1 sulfonate ABC transporter ATP-binding protein [Caballeronia choica]
MNAITSLGIAGIAGDDLEAELRRAPAEVADVTGDAPSHGRTRTVGDRQAAPLGREAARADDADFAIELRNVDKRYGERHVLSNFDFSIERGSFVSIVGRSGCGKSTLLRLIAGLEAVSGGTLARRSAREHSALQTRIMFQDARLLPWKTVLQNVMLGLPKSSRDAARAVLAEVGLSEREGDWPAQLSGGQRQRVALARALVHRPDLLLLDEPLGALDALTRIEMHALIERLWREHRFTALLVTHDVQEAVALGDRIVLIEEGRISFDAPIGLARPRSRASAAFAALEGAVLTRVLGNAPGESVRDEAASQEVHPLSIRWAV